MYKQPINTGYKLSTEPTICSLLMGRIGWKCPRKTTENECNKTSKSQNTNQNEQIKQSNETNVKSKGKEPKVRVRKLQKITVGLPLALESNDAYTKGLADCETCTLTRMDYKTEMQALRVTDTIVDGVIEKEESQSIEEDDLCEDVSEKINPKLQHSKTKGDKVSCKLEIYCESKEIEHNLKCILINLQRSLSNVIVQICFVKSRKLTNEDRYRKFDVSINDLKILRFECSNLTDKIIQLFKSPLGNKNYKGGYICIACIKEKLTEYNDMLDEVLKSGSNLKVVMRQEGFPQSIGQCCQRTYPHIHAEVQGKPVVLKYTMPFNIAKTPKKKKPKRPPTSRNDNQPDDLPKKKKKHLKNNKDHGYPISNSTPYATDPQESMPPFDISDQDSIYDVKELPKPSASRTNSSENNISQDDLPPTVPLNTPPQRPSYGQSSQTSTNIPENILETIDMVPNEPFDSPPQDYLDNPPLEPFDAPTKTPSDGPPKTFSSGPPRTSFDGPTKTPSDGPSQTSSNGSPRTSSDGPTRTSFEGPAETLSDGPSRTSSNGAPRTSSDEPPQTASHDSLQTPSEISLQMQPEDAHQKLIDKPLQMSPSGPPKQQKRSDNNPPKKSPSQRSSSISITNSFLDDLFDDDISDKSFKEKRKKKQVSFASKKNETTVLPLLVDQSISQLFPLESSFEKNDKNEETDKTPFGTVPAHVPIYVAAVDSVILTKQRLSQTETCNKTFVSDVQSQAIISSFKPADELDNDVNTIQGIIIPNAKEITHENKKVEKVLKSLGTEHLISVSTPADCCGTSTLLMEYESDIDLPLCASLNSLPLDHNDLKYIVKAAGTNISHEDIVLVPEDEILVKEYKWEMEDNNDEEPEKTKWTRAFAGTEISSDQYKEGKRAKTKNSTIREDTLLPTIDEEESLCNDDDKPFPVENIPSVALQVKEENKNAEIKPHLSKIKQRTMELRYFTVEFPNFILEKKIHDEDHVNTGIKSNNNDLLHEKKPNLEQNLYMGRGISALEGELKTQASCESFHSCCSSVSDLSIEFFNLRYDDAKTKPNQVELKSIDEIIMLNAIYLINREEDKYFTSLWKPSKNDSHQSLNKDLPIISPVENFNYPKRTPCEAIKKDISDNNYMNEQSHFVECNIESNQRQVKHKQSYIISKNVDDEINFYNPQHLQSYTNKNTTSFQEPNSNNSSTTIKNLYNELSFSDIPIINSTRSRLLCTQNEMGKQSCNIINSQVAKTDHVNDIQNHQTLEIIESSLVSRFVRLNKSYTILKNENKNVNVNIGTFQTPTNVCTFIPNQINVVNKRSYTIVKDFPYQRNIFNIIHKPDITPQKLQTEKDTYCGTKQVKKLIKATNMTKRNNCTQQDNWSKLKICNVNVKNYISQQKRIAELEKQQKKKGSAWRNYKELKRKPYFPLRSTLNYSLSKCRISLPELKFATLCPIAIENRITYMLYKTSTDDAKFYESSTPNKMKQEQETNTPGKCFVPLLVKTEQEIKSQVNIDNYVEKCFSYMDVKNHFAPQNMAEKRSSNNTNHLPITNLATENVKNNEMVSSKGNLSTRIFNEELSDSNKSSTFCTVQQNCGSKTSSNCEILKSRLNTHNPYYLYDIHGRPLTDNSGQSLYNSKGSSLLIFDDKSGLPMFDIDNNPIFDSNGFTLNDDDFNPTKPHSVNILKNLTTTEGNPMVLYDIDGRPLTSASGTMLVDSSGQGLIRFSCTGNPVSDCRGKPIYNLNGFPVTD